MDTYEKLVAGKDAFSRVLVKAAQYAQDKLTGHNPLPEMPLEVELLVAAWDNMKKNYTDEECADALMGAERNITEKTDEICQKIDELIMDLVAQYQRPR